jgi:hypothetical protein
MNKYAKAANIIVRTMAVGKAALYRPTVSAESKKPSIKVSVQAITKLKIPVRKSGMEKNKSCLVEN